MSCPQMIISEYNQTYFTSPFCYYVKAFSLPFPAMLSLLVIYFKFNFLIILNFYLLFYLCSFPFFFVSFSFFLLLTIYFLCSPSSLIALGDSKSFFEVCLFYAYAIFLFLMNIYSIWLIIHTKVQLFKAKFLSKFFQQNINNFRSTNNMFSKIWLTNENRTG